MIIVYVWGTIPICSHELLSKKTPFFLFFFQDALEDMFGEEVPKLLDKRQGGTLNFNPMRALVPCNLLPPLDSMVVGRHYNILRSFLALFIQRKRVLIVTTTDSNLNFFFEGGH